MCNPLNTPLTLRPPCSSCIVFNTCITLPHLNLFKSYSCFKIQLSIEAFPELAKSMNFSLPSLLLLFCLLLSLFISLATLWVLLVSPYRVPHPFTSSECFIFQNRSHILPTTSDKQHVVSTITLDLMNIWSSWKALTFFPCSEGGCVS